MLLVLNECNPCFAAPSWARGGHCSGRKQGCSVVAPAAPAASSNGPHGPEDDGVWSGLISRGVFGSARGVSTTARAQPKCAACTAERRDGAFTARPGYAAGRVRNGPSEPESAEQPPPESQPGPSVPPNDPRLREVLLEVLFEDALQKLVQLAGPAPKQTITRIGPTPNASTRMELAPFPMHGLRGLDKLGSAARPSAGPKTEHPTPLPTGERLVHHPAHPHLSVVRPAAVTTYPVNCLSDEASHKGSIFKCGCKPHSRVWNCYLTR